MMLSVVGQLQRPFNVLTNRTIAIRRIHIKRAKLYEKCYLILGVDNNADQNTVRMAYIDLVKRVHPDSGHEEACSERFQAVDEAFKVLQEKFAKSKRSIIEDEEEVVHDIKHTAPQHRQYLSFDGVGIGSPFQREKQYQQVKAMKAQERVLRHRVDKAQAGEASLMKKGSFYKDHAIKTKYGIDRIVEDLIQEAMSKGDFNNLNGAGKPLTTAQTQNPYLDFTTHKLNKILLDNGFTPEWITLSRDIREAIAKLKDDMRAERAHFGDLPLTLHEQDDWAKVTARFAVNVKEINKNIDKYNLIVPILENQYFRLKLEKIEKEILEDPLVPRNVRRPQPIEAVSNSNQDDKKSNFLSLLSSLF